MGERGEIINELQERSEQLNNDSANFAAKVRELRKREEKKSMCGGEGGREERKGGGKREGRRKIMRGEGEETYLII
jgi:hypothetical protein